VEHHAQSLYFWHIPKTAGTSFTGWLESHFRSEDVFRVHLLPDLRSTSDADVRSKLLYRGHFGAELPQLLNRPVTCLTLLREPRARALSHLNHIWRAPDHYLHERIRRSGSDLAAVLADPVVRLAVTDMQARYLAVDPAGSERLRVPVSVPSALLGQVQYELMPLPPRSVLARRAMLRLLGMTGFGFAEDLDSFVTGLAARLGWAQPEPLPRSNAKPAGSSPWSMRELTQRELTMLDQLNPVDGPLYRRARRADAVRRRLRRAESSRRRPPADRVVTAA
jgi:hypothetical protein